MTNNQIGALWAHYSPKCGEYLSGKIDGVPVVCFAQAVPIGTRRPKWMVLQSFPVRPKTTGRPSKKKAARPSKKTARATKNRSTT